jgi:hypothetical protein
MLAMSAQYLMHAIQHVAWTTGIMYQQKKNNSSLLFNTFLVTAFRLASGNKPISSSDNAYLMYHAPFLARMVDVSRKV